jgi:hypothetical protein
MFLIGRLWLIYRPYRNDVLEVSHHSRLSLSDEFNSLAISEALCFL